MKFSIVLIMLLFISCNAFKQSNISNNNREIKILIFLEDDNRIKEQEIFLKELTAKAKQYNISIIYETDFPENSEVENKIQSYLDFPKRHKSYGSDSRFYTYLDELILKHKPDEIAIFEMIYWDKKKSSTYLNIYNTMQSNFYNIFQSRNDVDDILSDLLDVDLSNRPIFNANKLFKNTLDELKCNRLNIDGESLGHLYTPEDIKEDLDILNKYLIKVNSFITFANNEGSFENYITKLLNEKSIAEKNKSSIENIYHRIKYFPLRKNNTWLYEVISHDGKKYKKRIEVESYWINQAHLLKESYDGLAKFENYYVLIWDNLNGILYETGRNVGSNDFDRFQYSIPILQFVPSIWQYDLNSATYMLEFNQMDSLIIDETVYYDIIHIHESNVRTDISNDYYYANKIGLIKLEEFDNKNKTHLSSSILRDYSLVTE
ncbi:MAG TPA: hypothetical protein DHV28_00355 [Ignavibacteriales bacterium]|nr:hypothetical protein [Ignavibacteriales bacterium]